MEGMGRVTLLVPKQEPGSSLRRKFLEATFLAWWMDELSSDTLSRSQILIIKCPLQGMGWWIDSYFLILMECGRGS